GAVGRHQPEIQRPHAGLGQERHRENACPGVQQAAVGLRHQRDFQGQVGHVQRAGDAIDQRRADQEQRRGQQIDGNHQTVGSCQQYLEEHEQVEQVRRQEGAVEAHQLDLEQRMETGTGAVPAGRSEEQGADADDA
ncbi:hypothetical protein E4T56_gene14144, partial [Termitomyces sp. T112]